MPIYNVSNTTEVQKVYTVSALNQASRRLLEGHFAKIWIEGEISNLARPSSGHLYFSLKDERAQIRCAMFRNRSLNMGFSPNDGDQVLIKAQVSLYEGRGDFQLIVDSMELAGTGALQKAYQQLKEKLRAAGYFDASHKNAIPRFAQSIGVITSPTGAAVRDILSTLKRRFPATPVIIYPTEVQGKQATESIARAIKQANQHRACDCLILARGGGSIEDLWAFNEVAVAKAIFQSRLPIITGIGHETDDTIADFIADLRAPTPTAAAEAASPNILDIMQLFKQYQARLSKAQNEHVVSMRTRLEHLKLRLPKLQNIINYHAQTIDRLSLQLNHSLSDRLQRAEQRLEHWSHRLHRQNPRLQLAEKKQSLLLLQQALQQTMDQKFRDKKEKLAPLVSTLRAVSPLATLERGYAVALDETKQVISEASQIPVGGKMTLRFSRSQLTAKVLSTQTTLGTADE